MGANKTSVLREELDRLPHKWLEVIIQFLRGFRNETMDFSRPQLRPSVNRIYPVFVAIYAVIVVFGAVANVLVVWTIARRRLNKDPTYAYIVNLAVANIVKCVVVLPVSLTILLVQNWIFGSFLCFFVPMLQDIPLHVSMLTFLLIAADRHRLILNPRKPRLPPFACIVGTWLLAVCIVLPYPIYTTYLDLGSYIQDQFKGVGICAVNLADDLQEYMRGLFIVMYVLPLAVIAYLYVRVSREIKAAEGPLAIMMFEARSRAGSSDHDINVEAGRRAPCRAENHVRPGNFDLYEAEVDVNKEKRNQKYLISMVTLFAICLCPLMVLRLAKLALTETYENSGHFDITYTLFVWIAFIPTCTTPSLFAGWRLSRKEKARLREQFCLKRSDRRPRVPGVGREARPGDITYTQRSLGGGGRPDVTQDLTSS